MSGFPERWPAPFRHDCGCGGGCPRCGAAMMSPDWTAIDGLARRSLNAALAHAQHGRFEVEAGSGIGTPGDRSANFAKWTQATWTGWMGPTKLVDVLRGPTWKEALQPGLKARYPAFTAKPPRDRASAGKLYRIWKDGKTAPLYIGMAWSVPIANRLAAHLKDAVIGLSDHTKRHAGTSQATMNIEQKKRANLARRAASSGKSIGGVFKKSGSESERLRLLLVREDVLGGLGSIMVAHGDIEPQGRTRLDPKTLHIFELALMVAERPQAYIGHVTTFEDEP